MKIHITIEPTTNTAVVKDSSGNVIDCDVFYTSTSPGAAPMAYLGWSDYTLDVALGSDAAATPTPAPAPTPTPTPAPAS